MITAKTKICMVIGDPIEHSLSPQLHNAGYKALHIENQFVYVACRVDVKNIKNFIKGVRAMNIHAISCTVPHKIAVMQHLDEIDMVAKKIGAVNTIVNENGKLKGYNTDWIGILAPLDKLTTLEGKKIAVIGAGGAARAATYAIARMGADISIYNRTFKTAKALAEEYGGKAFSLDEIEKIKNAEIIINATSVGMEGKSKTPLPKEYITKNHIVFDIVYGKDETRLLQEAQVQGATIIKGTDMLLYQAMAQFKMFTGHDAPEEPMREALP